MDVAWDGIPLQEVLFAVVVARTEVGPVPAGARRLRERLSTMDGFQKIAAKRKVG
jgi:hypothetical protein